MNNQDQLNDLMSQLGNFGKYQFIQHCLHCLAWLTAAVHMMSFVFVFPVLEHRCYVNEVDSHRNVSLDSFAEIDVYIPKNLKGVLDSCHMYGNPEGKAANITSCDDGYVYDSSYFTSSRITEFNMVCEKDWMRALLQSVFLFGTLTGGFFCGQIADKFGRKPIFCISGILQCAFGVIGVFLESYVSLAVCMFFYGLFGASGAVVPSVALTMEVVGPKARVVCGTMLTVWFGVGAAIVASWAYFLPLTAHQLQLIYAMHSIFLFGHFWLMDESISWLWTNNQQDKAIKIVEKAVKMNGGTFVNRYSSKPEQIDGMTEVDLNEPNATHAENENKKDVKPQKNDSNPPNRSALDLFRFPNLRKRMLIMLYCWFATNLSYFGLSFNSVNLVGNPFLMFIVNIVMEIPGHILSIFLVAKTGYRPLYAFSLMHTGLSCIVVGLIPGGWISNSITMFAKVSATIAFNVVNSYTAELFPTCLRNTAIGLCIMAARSGASIIPEINLLTSAAEEIPTITFGTAGILAALFTFFMLPETMNKTIPQTIDDVETPSKMKDSGKSIV